MKPARHITYLALGGLLGLASLSGQLACRHPTTPPAPTRQRPGAADAPLSVLEALGATPATPPGGPDGRPFARALVPRPFVFPEDHGPHPDFRTEWWYWTGNLAGDDGRRFGYQLTIFRMALAPGDPHGRSSHWAANQVYMGHLALTDVAGGRFHFAEQTSRAALGLAGATALPFRVWVLGWSADGPADPNSPSLTPLTLRADGADGASFAIDLVLEVGKPMVLHGRAGESGLSRKGRAPGNASYYDSLTRMPTRGGVTVGGVRYPVTGESWMDREWSTSALEAGQVGWDWFALQLSDGRELMFYRLRRADGATDPLSSGTLVGAGDGAGGGAPATRHLPAGAVDLSPLGTWVSPRSGARYPASFRLQVPSEGLDLRITPLLADQELALSFRYWEGAVAVSGTAAAGAPISGRGYVELTGYGDGRASGIGASKDRIIR